MMAHAVMRFKCDLAAEYRPPTVKRKLSALQCFIRWTKSDSPSVPVCPLLVYSSRTPPAFKRSHLPLEEAAQTRLLEVARASGSRKEGAILTLLLRTGLRVSELELLRWSDVRMCARHSAIHIASRWGGRRIPLNLEAQHALCELGYRKGEQNPGRVLDARITRRVIERCLDRFSREAGLERLTLQSLRDSYIQDLLSAGLAGGLVAEWAGIRRLEVLRMYSHVSGSEKMHDLALERANGACELCGSTRDYPGFLVLVKAVPGADDSDNWLVLCPNCKLDFNFATNRNELRARLSSILKARLRAGIESR
jgi:integrase